MNVSVYDIHAYDIHIYCKIGESNIDTINHVYVISFGSGNNKFCLTAMYRKSKSDTIYIDRVEHNSRCVVNGSLNDFSEGTIKIVRISLWFMRSKFPDVTKFTLQDDSQLYCERGSKLYKLSLAYDYILKYNKTWYQSKFNAELPECLMTHFTDSLKILDEPLYAFDIVKSMVMAIGEFEEEYRISKTPREFINLLRKEYDTTYCFKVGKWLNNYMSILHIKLYNDSWFIVKDNIVEPHNYRVNELNIDTLMRAFYGSSRKLRNKKTKKSINYRLVSTPIQLENSIGYYSNLQFH